MRPEPHGNRDNLRRFSFLEVRVPGVGGAAREIRLTSKYLVASLAAQDHLDAHGFDLATEKVHRRARSHGGHVISFQMVYHFRNGVQAFLDREHVFVMHGTQIVSRFPCREVVGGVLEADRK